jgi:hypothetical protein
MPDVTATPIGTDGTQLQILARTIQLILSVVTVAVGGLLATYFWRRITRPKLNISKDSATIIPLGPDSDTWIYRTAVRNSGRRAAKNCKVKLCYKVNTKEKTYEVSTTEQWAERDNPTRITINAGETSQFNILKYNETDNTISFPSSSDPGPESPIYEYDKNRQSVYQSSQTNIAISPEEIASGDVDCNMIKVTSENAASVEAEIKINIESEDLVTVRID